MASQNTLVFGGTSPLGLQVLKEALQKGHKVTAYVRSPEKVPEDLRADSNLEVITGQLDDTAALRSALQSQPRLIISCVGPTLGGPRSSGSLFAEFYQRLVSLIQEIYGDSQPPRLFALSTPSFWVPEDTFTLSRAVGINLVRLVFNYAYTEMVNIGTYFNSGAPELESVEWVVYRVGGLSDDDAAQIEAGYVGDGKWGFMGHGRPGIARWLLREGTAENCQWLRKNPALYAA